MEISVGDVKTALRLDETSVIAFAAKTSDIKFAFLFHIASIECERASSAVATVVSRGTVNVNSGSTIAASG